jgi:hypothetical protein
MLRLFRAVIERLKLLFAGAAVRELELDCLAAQAQRRAELLRLANAYEADGLTAVAAGLRRQLGRPAAAAGHGARPGARACRKHRPGAGADLGARTRRDRPDRARPVRVGHWPPQGALNDEEGHA